MPARGDSLVLGPVDSAENGVDEGEADFEEEALPLDPAEQWEGEDDTFVTGTNDDEDGIGSTDLTGTATGIARGFGSHQPLDLGAGGFQIEDEPTRRLKPAQTDANGELSDYDG